MIYGGLKVVLSRPRVPRQWSQLTLSEVQRQAVSQGKNMREKSRPRMIVRRESCWIQELVSVRLRRHAEWPELEHFECRLKTLKSPFSP